MARITRRSALALGSAAVSAAALPRFAIGQADNRPSITIAVQKISNSNTLDCLREQSNVGTRMATFYTERLIDLNYQGRLESVPGLATAWRRIVVMSGIPSFFEGPSGSTRCERADDDQVSVR